jgi:tRNA pseudouridine38-40 synthase
MAADPNHGNGIILIIEYNGTNYHGSQLQKDAKTIQGELEKALKKLTGERIRIKTASRTDAGVHATRQVVSFWTTSILPLKSYIDGLNHYLPRDIAVQEAFKTHEPYDVRRRAVSREYKYYILNRRTRSPIKQDFFCRVAGPLDIAAMNRACEALIGRHDFASFVSSVETARQKQTVRDVFKAEIIQDGDMIIFDIIANSFLPHQVRNTIGPLIKVGQGKMTVESFKNMIQAATPGLARPTAPADGLCLVQVNYPGPFEGDIG